MKKRIGFVSNSSSSSFILHRKALEDEPKFDEIVNELNEIAYKQYQEIGHDPEWGDSCKNYEESNGYLLVEMHNPPDGVRELMKPFYDFGFWIDD